MSYAMQYIATDRAPAAIGPYAQAVRAGNLLFCSGQIPIDPTTQAVNAYNGDVAKQARLVLQNLAAVLEAGGSSLQTVVKTTVYLQSMSEFPRVNDVYAEIFGAHTPARACVEVARLPKDVLVEIDAIAVISPVGAASRRE
jgi:2-iminobutanoate/2-iminopropanoate deaminase